MINLNDDRGIKEIEICDPISVEDGIPFKEALLSISSEVCKIKINTERELHITLCLLLYELYNQNINEKLQLIDENEIVKKSFSRLGLNTEYNAIKI